MQMERDARFEQRLVAQRQEIEDKLVAQRRELEAKVEEQRQETLFQRQQVEELRLQAERQKSHEEQVSLLQSRLDALHSAKLLTVSMQQIYN